ncbi:unnamed protein product [Heterobilharzia americana]|nr:unnamed protein product [Heterobilharzia americana]
MLHKTLVSRLGIFILLVRSSLGDNEKLATSPFFSKETAAFLNLMGRYWELSHTALWKTIQSYLFEIFPHVERKVLYKLFANASKSSEKTLRPNHNIFICLF